MCEVERLVVVDRDDDVFVGGELESRQSGDRAHLGRTDDDRARRVRLTHRVETDVDHAVPLRR